MNEEEEAAPSGVASFAFKWVVMAMMVAVVVMVVAKGLVISTKTKTNSNNKKSNVQNLRKLSGFARINHNRHNRSHSNINLSGFLFFTGNLLCYNHLTLSGFAAVTTITQSEMTINDGEANDA